MTGFTLLNSSRDVFQKLLLDYAALERDSASAYKAVDCASSAWHLTDWVYHEYETPTYGHLGFKAGIGAMRAHFYSQCPELPVMHDVTTGAKHMTVSAYKSDMSGSSTDWQDVYSETYCDTYGVKMLMVTFANGSSESMLSLLNKVIVFWTVYLEGK